MQRQNKILSICIDLDRVYLSGQDRLPCVIFSLAEFGQSLDQGHTITPVTKISRQEQDGQVLRRLRKDHR